MNRRKFFGKGVKVTAGVAALSGLPLKQVLASDRETDATVEISNNHGHDLALSIEDLVGLLRRLQPEEGVESLSIQGQSHPHNIDIGFDDVLSILLG